MRIALVGVLLLIAMPRPAAACGFWSMTDKEKTITVGFLINSAEIKKGDKRLAMLYLDIENKSGLRVVRKHEVVFDIKNGKLRKLGKPVATIDADGITFGKRKYTIELTNPHKIHDALPAFDLTVTRGDVLVLTSAEASSLCAGMHDPASFTEDDAREEVRRRVMFYLAWREVGAT